MPKYKSDIPVYMVKDIYDRLTDTFGSDVVLIGGRAVNIYCFKNQRSTHDIDVMVRQNPSEINDFSGRAIENGFMLRKEGSQIVGVTDMKSNVAVDFFYKGDLGGIDGNDIFATAQERQLTNSGTVKIIDPALLILSKCTANRYKDRDDIRNLITNLYKDVPAFLDEEKDKLNKHADLKRLEQYLSQVMEQAMLAHSLKNARER